MDSGSHQGHSSSSVSTKVSAAHGPITMSHESLIADPHQHADAIIPNWLTSWTSGKSLPVRLRGESAQETAGGGAARLPATSIFSVFPDSKRRVVTLRV